MDIIVFSDSHGNTDRMARLIDLSGADIVLHLGDGAEDFEKLALRDRRRRLYIGVRGNCDRFSRDLPEIREFEREGVRFLLLHGHTHHVKHGTGELERCARERGADIVLYGHTHTPDDRFLPGGEGEKPLRILNPGSIGSPFRPSFATITLREGQLLTNCASAEGR